MIAENTGAHKKVHGPWNKAYKPSAKGSREKNGLRMHR